MEIRRVLVLGAKGTLGGQLMRLYPEATGWDREDADVLDAPAFQAQFVSVGLPDNRLPWQYSPPLELVAMLPVNVQLVSVSGVPLMHIPPPTAAVLPLNVQFVSIGALL